MPSQGPNTDTIISSLQASGLAISNGIRSAVRLALGSTLEHQPAVLTGSPKAGTSVNLLQLYAPGEIPSFSAPTLSVELLRDDHVLVLKFKSDGHFTAVLYGYFFFSTGIRHPQDPQLLHGIAGAMLGVVKNVKDSIARNAELKGGLLKPVPRAALKDWASPRPVLGNAPSNEERIELLKSLAL